MKFSTSTVISAVVLPALVSAHDFQHNVRHAVHARQAASSAASAATSPAASSAAASGAASSGALTTGASSAVSQAPTASFSLLSSNPNAVPLASINAAAPSQATVPLDTTYAAGATPTVLSSAPPLPNPSSIVISQYPALDKVPPTDSDEVKQWIQEVQNSGINIPGFSPTVAGGCPANPSAVSDSSRCWWTCSGCTRDTDITTCPDKLTWGLTYDDGPSPYTPTLLNYLDEQSLKSTFFVVGSRALSYPATLQAEYMGGHQVAVHTWSHPQLTTLTNEEIIAELGWTKKIIKDVTGVTPNMMRPPYGDIDDRVRAICTAMGLTPVMWTRISTTATFDTGDFDIHSGVTSVSQVLANWENILGNATTINTGFIVLEHDLFQQSVDVATGYILPDALANKYKIQPVVNCVNKPLSDAYIETNDNSTNPPIASGAATLSSGAPGSAQQTGKSGDDSKNSAASPLASSPVALGLFTAVVSLLGSAAAILM
ncbi:glycoside hydrolase/deacetylase [Gloeophyllum trabeum ATCC 11539]|uniref:chitin deacetylase n=1 Tax=Gloeophyllum trabeum (strain ATCC 11539 / FP-39264 / Madison 617) TaxID=670483 RepID=S7QNZ1_GLOTA|nr:glycoside hydrolase/deacetylase [Gloeophyllum trabeum ATCC 11539]EPQ61017.1 glycoside hydrolase/deacetylase [Gloeophyllum trabeum ATCC 11539]